MITDDAELHQLRDIIIKALGLPSANAACVFIVAADTPSGHHRQRLCVVGLAPEALEHVLTIALEQVRSSQAQAVVQLVAPGAPD